MYFNSPPPERPSVKERVSAARAAETANNQEQGNAQSSPSERYVGELRAASGLSPDPWYLAPLLHTATLRIAWMTVAIDVSIRILTMSVACI